jgi:hypothetical protein
MGIETPELQEQLEKAIERAEEEVLEKAAPPWLFQLSLSTALVAVIASIASMQAERLANRSLLAKNDAILNQARASDLWSYYQAKSIKKILYETHGHRAQAEHYQKELDDLKASAETLQKKVEDDERQSDELFGHHHHFALAVTLFQVTIALSAIASLTRQKPLWWLGLLASGVGLIITLVAWL